MEALLYYKNGKKIKIGWLVNMSRTHYASQMLLLIIENEHNKNMISYICKRITCRQSIWFHSHNDILGRQIKHCQHWVKQKMGFWDVKWHQGTLLSFLKSLATQDI